MSNAGSGHRMAHDICPKCGAQREDAQLGQEPLHDCLGWATGEECGTCFVCHLVAVFREVWRVLRRDGTVWLDLGDSFAGSGGAGGDYARGGLREGQPKFKGTAALARSKRNAKIWGGDNLPSPGGLKPKDLIGIPWRVALALQADGWYLRSDIIWEKPNPMPESVRDRPTKSHEHVFLLTKSPHYFYDAPAIAESAGGWNGSNFDDPRDLEIRPTTGRKPRESKKRGEFNGKTNAMPGREAFRAVTTTRNRRDVWTIPTSPFKGAHFASFPPKLVETCILASTSERGVCPECGEPWERVVTREFVAQTDVSEQRGVRGATGQKPMDVSNGWDGQPRGIAHTITTGWRPTCDHDAEPVPAVVLDPFCGSGTVGVVAQKHGRQFVGLDLSMTYLRDIALPRIMAAPRGLGI